MHADDPRLFGNPVLLQPDYQSKGQPLVIHLDGAEYTQGHDSITTLQWSLLGSAGFSWTSIFFVMGLPKKCIAVMAKHFADTWGTAWPKVAKSFNILFWGFDPELPVGENLIANGEIFGFVFVVCADHDALTKDFKCPHCNSENPCIFCPASRNGRLNIRDLRTNAGWKAEVFTPAQVEGRRPTDHPIWDILGLSRFSIGVEQMHTLEYGPTVNMLGSSISELVHDGPYGGTLDQNMNRFNGDLAEEYDRQGTRYRITRITRSMFETSSFACLGHIRASEARALVPVILALVRKYNNGTDHDLHRLLALDLLNQMYSIIMPSGHFLTEEQSSHLLELCDLFLLHYNWLTNDALSSGRKLYNITYKTHMIWHMCAMAKYLNCRSSWAYGFENFMGKICRSAHAVINGTPIEQVGGKLARNYLMALEIELRQMDPTRRIPHL